MRMTQYGIGASILLGGGLCLAAAEAECVRDLNAERTSIERKLAELEQAKADARQALHTLDLQAKAEKEKSPDIYQTQFHLPRLPKAPVIDGRLSPGEWNQAVRIPLGSGTGWQGLLERPSSVFYVGWDADHIYFGQRLELREGEKLKRVNREPKHDHVAPWETSLEAYIDRNTFGSHPSLCRWQFMGNAVGNRWDYEDQYQIGQRNLDWDAEWEYKQSLSEDGRHWEAEIAIPRTSVYQEDPIQPGQGWKIGLATNLQNPGIGWSGFYGASIPTIFSETVPVIGFANPERIVKEKALVFDMDVGNPLDAAFSGEVVAAVSMVDRATGKRSVLVERRLPVALKPGEQRVISLNHPLGDTVPDLTPHEVSIMVLEGGRSIYTWSRMVKFNDPGNRVGVTFTPDPDPFTFDVAYAPLSRYFRATVDIYDYARVDDVQSAQVAFLSPDGTVKASERLTDFQYGKVDRQIDLPALEPGTYTCRVKLLDNQGATLSESSREVVVRDLAEFPWIGNTIGEEDHIPAPFEPLKAEAHTLRAYGKTIAMQGLALPEQVAVRGQNLLQSPIRLEGTAGGKPFVADGAGSRATPTSASNVRAVYEASTECEGVAIRVESLWEYDSTGRITLRVKPVGDPVDLDGLRLVIPFGKDASLNYMTIGANFRQSCAAGRIPGDGKPGVVWTSKEVPYQKMTVGSFVPVVWVGNQAAGMTWFADSDRGWWPDAVKPALEIIRREDGGVDLVANLASGKVALDGEREIVFGLNVNPVRPMSDSYSSAITFGFLQEAGRWVPGKSDRKEFALRYPQDPVRNREVAEAYQRYASVYAPYTETSKMDIPEDLYAYFGEDLDAAYGPSFGLMINKVFSDIALYETKRWIEDCGGNGFYFDNVYPRTAYNPRTGAAYTLPDGRVQPGYCLWGQRAHMKRMRVLLDQTRPKYRICIHNTRFQFAPIMAFADLAMGGEMATPAMGTPDFIDMHPRDFMEVQYNPYLWGYRLSHLYHFKNQSYVDAFGNYDAAAAEKVHRSAQATMLAHGMEFFGKLEGDASDAIKYQLLKKLNGGALECIPLWAAEGRFEVLGEPEKSGAVVWRGDDSLIVILSNFDAKARTLRLEMNLPELIRKPGDFERREVVDFETFRSPGNLFERNVEEADIPRVNNLASQSMIPNVLRVPVEGHDYRIILIANTALSKGVSF